MRLLIGGVAAVLAAVVVGVFALGGDSVSLANAADRMQGKDLRANVTLKMSVEGTNVTMKGFMLQSADLKRYLMDVKGDVAGADVSQKLVMVGKDMWLTSPSFEPALPEGKTWVKMGDELPNLGSMTFEEMMAFCEAATDISKRGEETIDGVRTTHYVGTVDMKAAAQALGDKAPELGADAMKMPLELWLDERGNAVRMKMDQTVEGLKASFTMDGFEYDVDVSSIKAPPAGEVVAASEVGLFS